VDKVHRWVPPPVNCVCINVDAALFHASRIMGLSAVFQYHNGAFLLSCSESMSGFPVPEMAEAASGVSGFIGDQGTWLEEGSSGFRLPFTNIENLGPSLISHFSRFCHRVHQSSEDELESFLFRFSNRLTNVVAHKLARSAEPSFCNVLIGVIQEFIREKLYNVVA
jgi:hypothetical protein